MSTATTSQNHLVITYLSITTLLPDGSNPRHHTKRQIKQIAQSILTFGFLVPLLIDASRRIVAGHGRFFAAQQLGYTDVPTICVTHLTPEQIRAFMIADNRLGENSTWDERLLAEQFKELLEADLDFSLEVTGFDFPEIELRMEGLESTEGKKSDPDDTLSNVEPGPAISRPGDLLTLGRHRLLCASSLEPESYPLLMGKDKAHLVFTDPPYNVKIHGHVTGGGSVKHREFAMAAGEMSRAEFTQFLAVACGFLAEYSRPAAIHFLCIDWRHLPELLAAGQQVYGDLKNLCVWTKTTAGMGSFYRSQHELVAVFQAGKGRARNNIQLGKFGRNRSNVWSYPSPSAFGRMSEEGKLLDLHPTVKPVKLVADALLDCSARGDVVLDNFLGSGTTLLAAERTGRRCFGIELDPLYVDVAIRRWQAYTGETAVRASDGKSFNEIEQEVRHG